MCGFTDFISCVLQTSFFSQYETETAKHKVHSFEHSCVVKKHAVNSYFARALTLLNLQSQQDDKPYKRLQSQG